MGPCQCRTRMPSLGKLACHRLKAPSAIMSSSAPLEQCLAGCLCLQQFGTQQNGQQRRPLMMYQDGNTHPHTKEPSAKKAQNRCRRRVALDIIPTCPAMDEYEEFRSSQGAQDRTRMKARARNRSGKETAVATRVIDRLWSRSGAGSSVYLLWTTEHNTEGLGDKPFKANHTSQPR